MYRKVCLLEKAPPLGELDAVRRPERARTLAGRLRPGLDDANDGADFRKAQSKLARCVFVSGLALSVIASRCHLSQSERFWIYRNVCLLEKAPTLGELARSA